nr:MAG TPA: Major tail protein [Bacteriophage sp.]DAI43922.1 MAG TPA: Major tail protein [Caudoviricetes sp.]
MASTSYLARVIFKEHTEDGKFAGTYKLLVKAKSIPSPASAPNTVESTTLEDDTQTFEMGIKTSDSKEITGNLEKDYLDNIDDLAGKKLDIIHLYGTDGIGGVAKYAYVGQAVATPSDVGGTDEILEMSATIVPNTAAKKVTDDFTVVDNKNGTFTVSVTGES